MANQSSRFPAFNSGDSRETPAQPLSNNAFSTSSWQPNAFWGRSNLVSPPLNNRDKSAMLQAQEDTFANNHTSAATFSSNATEATDMWPGSSSRQWTNTDSATSRKASVSPSPARMRDASSQSLHELVVNNSSASYLGAIAPSRPFVGGGSRPKAADVSATDVSTPSSFKYATSLRDSVADDDNDQSAAAAAAAASFTSFNFDHESARAARAQKDGQGGHGRHGRHHGHHGHGHGHGHAHRPSLQASSSFSSPILQSNTLAYHRNSHTEDEASLALADMVRRSMHVDDRTDTAAASSLGVGASGFGGTGGGLSPYAPSASTASGATASFQFNPGSQSWDANMVGGTHSAHSAHSTHSAHSVRTNSFGNMSQDNQVAQATVAAAAAAAAAAADPISAAAYVAAASAVRGAGGVSSIDRGTTPVGNASYRQVNSPSSMGTPSNSAGPWSRPSSRDPRGSSFDAGTIGLQELLQRQQQSVALYNEAQQQQQLTAAVNQSFPAGFFANGISPYTLYSNSFRSPMQVSALGLPQTMAFLPPPHVPLPMTPIARDRDPTRAFRSPVLDEFRSARTNRKYELRDIYDHIVEFSGDQHGSRFIQSKLETANSDEKEHVFREITANTLVLMRDVFGNYVVQKFFEHGNQVQKKYLAEQMRGRMVDLSMQTYACRVVQKALQHVLLDQQVSLAQELEADIVRVVKDQNGNHVVQKVIELVPREHIGFIMDAFRGRVCELASHNFGCRVIQRMLEYGSDDDKAAVLAELHENSLDLITDQFGNYVAQHVIQFGQPADRDRMIAKVMAQLVPMCKHKFASNVVEKCIEHGLPADRRRLCEELDRVGSDGVPVLQLMVKDQYGNYVIQKLLKQLTGEEHQQFAESLATQLRILRRPSFGRQNAAIERLAQAVEELPQSRPVTAPETAKTSIETAAETAAETTSETTETTFTLDMIETAVTTSSVANRATLLDEKARQDSTAATSPRIVPDQDSVPSLTSAPNTPESSNPPSVSAGVAGHAALDVKGAGDSGRVGSPEGGAKLLTEAAGSVSS